MTEEKKGLALHWQILIGMVAGVIFGLVFKKIAWGEGFVMNWIYPIGIIFVNLLKLIAVPLIIASLTKGIADLKDISKLSTIGGRTIGIYLVTTVVAVTLGLVVVNVIQPGANLSAEVMEQFNQILFR